MAGVDSFGIKEDHPGDTASGSKMHVTGQYAEDEQNQNHDKEGGSPTVDIIDDLLAVEDLLEDPVITEDKSTVKSDCPAHGQPRLRAVLHAPQLRPPACIGPPEGLLLSVPSVFPN